MIARLCGFVRMRRHSLLISGPLLVLFFFGVSLRDVVRMQRRLLLFEPLLVIFFFVPPRAGGVLS